MSQLVEVSECAVFFPLGCCESYTVAGLDIDVVESVEVQDSQSVLLSPSHVHDVLLIHVAIVLELEDQHILRAQNDLVVLAARGQVGGGSRLGCENRTNVISQVFENIRSVEEVWARDVRGDDVCAFSVVDIVDHVIVCIEPSLAEVEHTRLIGVEDVERVGA